MDVREKIKEFIKLNGPVLPVQISKQIESDILIASAYLSELSSNKELKVSSVKVGGSPLYYLPGQEADLQRFSDKLQEKEKTVYEILKNKKVLRDHAIESIVRVALRNIKDFAIPLQVNYKEKTEIFWKWYLLPNQETEQLIKEELSKEEEKKIDVDKNQQKKPEQKLKTQEKPAEATKQQIKKEQQKKLTKEHETKIPTDDFTNLIKTYFNQNKISIIEEKITRKNSEAEFIIELPSAVGKLIYYCKAKSKKRINEGDLSAAFITGQSKKLPVLFLTKGELTKKAKLMLEEEFKGMGVKKI